MSANMGPVPGWLSFRRIVDVPFETCVAALDSWQPIGRGGDLRFGDSLLRGPVEHHRGSGTCRIQVRLAPGPLRPLLRMRLDIDRWSSSSTAVELNPCRRVRPTGAYFRAGHHLLDSLTRSLPQHLTPAHARDTASQPQRPSVPGVRNPAGRRGRGLPGRRPPVALITPLSTGPSPLGHLGRREHITG